MAHVVIPFLMSLLLGRTIDLRTYTIGGDIYDHEDYRETPIHITNTSYTVLQENVFPYSYIGLPADLVLRIKSGFLHSSSGALGLDGLLRETSWKSNSVVIAVSTMVQTVLREINYDARPLDNWTTRVNNNQTHYAHSIMYGGWSAILYRFKCEVAGDEETVRKILTSVLGVHGDMNQNTIDLWKKAVKAVEDSEDLSGNVSVHIHAYSSVRHSEDVTSLDNFLKAIDKFSDDVGLVGQPLFVELRPLHKLNSNYPIVRPDHISDEDMGHLDELFDDLRSTKTSLSKWMRETLAEFSDKEEEKITRILEHITRCIHLFHMIAGEASIFKPMDKNLLKAALVTYNKGLTSGAVTYKQMFLLLKEDLDAECEDEFINRIKGTLKVAPNLRLEMGEVKGGLDECKQKCYKEKKCRAIGYAEQLPVLQRIEGLPRIQLIFKERQCHLYLRSSKTAQVTHNRNMRTYDRKCH